MALLAALPSRNTGKLLPNDWKDWARISLGVVTVNQANQAAQAPPPAWLKAIETMGVLMPFQMGLKKEAVITALWMAPLVGGLVAGSDKAQKTLAPSLKENMGVPKWLTQTALGLGATLLSIKTFPWVFRSLAKTGLLGQNIQKRAHQMASGVTTMICSRGCCQSAICVSEVGETLAGIGSFMTSAPHKASAQKPQEAV